MKNRVWSLGYCETEIVICLLNICYSSVSNQPPILRRSFSIKRLHETQRLAIKRNRWFPATQQTFFSKCGAGNSERIRACRMGECVRV